MISRESRTISGFRRSSTPRAPVEKRNAATARYHATLGPSTRYLATRVFPEDDAADRRDEQHDRRDLERKQVIGQKESADLGRTAEGAADVRRVRERSARLQTDHDDDLHHQRACGQPGAARLPARPARPRRPLA